MVIYKSSNKRENISRRKEVFQTSELSNLCEFLVNFKVHIKLLWLVFASILLFSYSSISSKIPSRTEGRELSIFSKPLIRFARIKKLAAQKKMHCRLCLGKWLKPIRNHGDSPCRNLVSSLIATWSFYIEECVLWRSIEVY